MELNFQWRWNLISNVKDNIKVLTDLACLQIAPSPHPGLEVCWQLGQRSSSPFHQSSLTHRHLALYARKVFIQVWKWSSVDLPYFSDYKTHLKSFSFLNSALHNAPYVLILVALTDLKPISCGTQRSIMSQNVFRATLVSYVAAPLDGLLKHYSNHRSLVE